MRRRAAQQEPCTVPTVAVEPFAPHHAETSPERRFDPMSSSPADLAFLLAGASWRDSFLHGFRSLYLIMEVILLGLSGGFLAATLTWELPQATVALLLLALLVAGSLVVLVRTRRVALALGDDVRFWHREIIRAERALPVERRAFTRFKLLQRSRRQDVGRLANAALSIDGLGEDGIEDLVEPFSKTRELLEVRVPEMIAVLWVAILLAGAAGVGLRALAGTA
jgi:hypothetical protein